MKINERTAYGHCGIDVRLNSMDQYVLGHTCDRLKEYFRVLDECHDEQEYNHILPPIEEINNLIVFLNKLGLKPEQEADVFKIEEKESEC